MSQRRGRITIRQTSANEGGCRSRRLRKIGIEAATECHRCYKMQCCGLLRECDNTRVASMRNDGIE